MLYVQGHLQASGSWDALNIVGMMYIRRQMCTDTTLKAILHSRRLATSDAGRRVANVNVSLADQPVKTDKQYKLVVVLYIPLYCRRDDCDIG